MTTVGKRKGARGGNRERTTERERSGERMRLIIQHYPCSLFMALLEQPAEAIYTHTYCRHRPLP